MMNVKHEFFLVVETCFFSEKRGTLQLVITMDCLDISCKKDSIVFQSFLFFLF